METTRASETIPADVCKRLLQSTSVTSDLDNVESVVQESAGSFLSVSENVSAFGSYEKALEHVLGQLRSTNLCKQIRETLSTAHSNEASYFNGITPSSNSPMLLSLLQNDPDLLPLVQEIDQLGALAFVTFWQKPEASGQSADDSPDAVGVYHDDDDDDDEELSLHAAALEGDRQLLTDLLHEGADVNEVDEEGRTAMHNASGLGEIGCVLILLSMGGDVNALDNVQNTPLHYAAGYGEFESVKVLLKNGADPTLKNVDGHTPLQLAKMNDEYDVVDILDRSLVRE